MEILKAFGQSRGFANRHRSTKPMFKVGTRVWLSTTNIKLACLTCKMSQQRVGPHKILAKTSKGLCKLELPPEMSRYHPVFHVSQLEPYKENCLLGRRQLDPGLVLVKNEPELNVKEVVDSQFQAGKLMYKVQWKGFSSNERYGWEPPNHLKHCPNLVKAYHLPYLTGPLPQDAQLSQTAD